MILFSFFMPNLRIMRKITNFAHLFEIFIVIGNRLIFAEHEKNIHFIAFGNLFI